MDLNNIVYLCDSDIINNRNINNYAITAVEGSRIYIEMLSKEWSLKLSLDELKKVGVKTWIEKEENFRTILDLYNVFLTDRDKIHFCSYVCDRQYMKLVCFLFIAYKDFDDINLAGDRADSLYSLVGENLEVSSYVSYSDDEIKWLNKTLERTLFEKDDGSYQKFMKRKRTIPEQSELLQKLNNTPWNNSTEIDYWNFYESIFSKKLSLNDDGVFATRHATDCLSRCMVTSKILNKNTINNVPIKAVEDISCVFDILYVLLAIWDYLIGKIIDGEETLTEKDNKLLVFQLLFFLNGQCLCHVNSVAFNKIRTAYELMNKSANS